MKRTIVLLLAGTVLASPAAAQMKQSLTRGLEYNEKERTRSETADLYASTISRLARIIDADVAADTGTTVIRAVESGQIRKLPSLDAETRQLINALGIEVQSVDANPDPLVEDQKIMIYVPDGSLRQGVTRADIEAAAKKLSMIDIVRVQNGTITSGASSGEALPAGMNGQGIEDSTGIYLGVSTSEKITSGTNGSMQVRTEPCPAGFHGTGIVSERTVDREVKLGGTQTDTFGAWTEVSRSCTADVTELTRYFDECTAPDGSTGRAVYEATQYIRQSASNPYETEIFVDTSTAVLSNDGQCVSGARDFSSADFLVDGRLDGIRELGLKTTTRRSDIGNGPGTVPLAVRDGQSGRRPVAGIAFDAEGVDDFQFTRTCAQEYGSVAIPAPYWSPTGSTVFDGASDYYRDYNRRETYFDGSRSSQEYIINSNLVLDDNVWGWPNKGRGPVDASNGPAPAGDGWYKYTETCARDLDRNEYARRERNCNPTNHPGYPRGTFWQERDGTGHYVETTTDNPLPNGPTLQSIDWNPWTDDPAANDCHRQRITTRDETQTRTVATGGQTCVVDEERTVTITTLYWSDGRPNTVTEDDPAWTEVGRNCVSSGGGGAGKGVIGTDGNYYNDAAAAGAAGVGVAIGDANAGDGWSSGGGGPSPPDPPSTGPW